MKILLIGSGGREHALAWKMQQSQLVKEIIVAPGNVGIAQEPKCRLADVKAEDVEGVVKLAVSEGVDLVVVGPEAPLVLGLADKLRASGIRVFGPSQKAAQLEGSKVFARTLLKKYRVPSPKFEVFDNADEAERFVLSGEGPLVVKADGLAAGKGVFVCKDREAARDAVHSIMTERIFGSAGDRIVIEEYLTGEEASFIAITDGFTVLPLATSQDHKPVFDGDNGPNTGGMGAYSPAPVVTPDVHEEVMNQIMIRVVKAMEREGCPYLGFLYAGLMIQNGEAKVLEFNVRMGDPEAQPLLFRMETDLVELMAAALDGTLADKDIDWTLQDAVCVVMASKGYPGSYEKGKLISGLEEAEAMEEVKVFHAGTGKNSEGYITTGGRVLGVAARGLGIASAIDRAYEAVSKIHWEGVHYRRDIGKKALTKRY
ncbi:MAG: phosphoribosylamine--glycine ligase [Desulfomonilaceae bacterium]